MALDFRLPHVSDEIYTAAEVTVRLDSNEALEALRRQLPLLETEVRLGVSSEYHAQRIWEIKRLGSDTRTVFIQDHLNLLARKRPRHFDEGLFNELHNFLLGSTDEFKSLREYRHLSRVVATSFLYRRATMERMAAQPQRRHLLMKLLPTRLRTGQVGQTLGVLVAVNLLRDNEVFDERHFGRALAAHSHLGQIVEGSLLRLGRPSERTVVVYAEIQKADGSPWRLQELRTLRRDLSRDVVSCIERRMHPIVMPANEEEIMRHIVTLSQQLRYVRDVPHMVVSFEEQSDTDLCFLVVLLRLVRDKDPPLSELLSKACGLQIMADRQRIVGLVRRRYAKEAHVLHVRLPKSAFLRQDQSLDLYRARQVVVSELTRLLGDVRDYNGGLLSKQGELLEVVREALAREIAVNKTLLEDFFHSIQPAVMRTILEPEVLKRLFLLINEVGGHGLALPKRGIVWKVVEEQNWVYAAVRGEDQSMKQQFLAIGDQWSSTPFHFATSCVTVGDGICIGYLHRSDEPAERKRFAVALEQALMALS
jgi:hypothetical protein